MQLKQLCEKAWSSSGPQLRVPHLNLTEGQNLEEKHVLRLPNNKIS